jgi:glycosyltransferase involved in cell wall biosynthesis
MNMQGMRPLYVSTFPPTACGLATFTQDLADSVDEALDEQAGLVAAILTRPDVKFKDRRVWITINNRDPEAYVRAGRQISDGPADVVSVQHEFGLYPGDWGEAILDLVGECRKPVVTTLHTLSANPDPKAKRIIRQLAAASEMLVVMTQTGLRLLKQVYQISAPVTVVIPHGVPDVQFIHRATLRRELALNGRHVLCTFGLLSRAKNIEAALKAMPRILEAFPEALYVVAGQTHPNVRVAEGETYREELCALAADLGITDAVRFINRYLGRHELIDLLKAADLYVSPYGGREQIVSGTLAYAMAAGRAVISTPFLYAAEVLAGGRGVLVDFDDAGGLANAAAHLLRDPALREDIEVRAYAYARRMIWPAVGSRYAAAFQRAVGGPIEVEPTRSISRLW